MHFEHGQAVQSFEKDLPTNKPNYANNTSATSGLLKTDEYRCAWGPNDANRPQMIRIVLNIVDAENRLPDGQNFEYVFQCH